MTNSYYTTPDGRQVIRHEVTPDMPPERAVRYIMKPLKTLPNVDAEIFDDIKDRLVALVSERERAVYENLVDTYGMDRLKIGGAVIKEVMKEVR